MLRSTTHHRVRYSETDQMSYLYHGRYAELYELGRTEMLRELGLTYAELEEKVGVAMPVMSLNQRFVRPAHYDELLTVTTELRRMPERTITFHLEIHNEAGKLVNGGSVKLCFVDTATGKTTAAPDYLLNAILPRFEKN